MPTFLTFGSKRFTNSLERIKSEAKALPFSSVLCVSEDDLKAMPEFWDKHGRFVETNPRGYGYWIWKSYLTWKTLREMSDGDILVYADAGCTLHRDPHAFISLFYGLMVSNGVSACTLEYMEHAYCKNDLAVALDAIDHLKTEQLHATFFALKRSPHTVRLVQTWYDIMADYHLIDDSPSITQNADTFIEHRHDQSVFSLLRKQCGVDYSITDCYPIEGTRLRN